MRTYASPRSPDHCTGHAISSKSPTRAPASLAAHRSFEYSIKLWLAASGPPALRRDAIRMSTSRKCPTSTSSAGVRFAGSRFEEETCSSGRSVSSAKRRVEGSIDVSMPGGLQPMTATSPVGTDAGSGRVGSLRASAAPCARADLGGALRTVWTPIAPKSRTAASRPSARTSRLSAKPSGASSRAFSSASPAGDFQESDQLLAGIMTNFGSPTGAVPFGGRGDFAGVMTGALRRPRVEGAFRGDDLRAWDTVWGIGVRTNRDRKQLRCQ